MTAEQTRQLGIEFERRCQTFDSTMATAGKIDTEDIYSFLNQYQLQLVKQLYISQDKLQDDTYTASAIREYLQSLIEEKTCDAAYISPNPDTKRFGKLPDKYFMYISSYTQFESEGDNYKKVPNILTDSKTAQAVVNDIYDSNRIIRKPLAVIKGDIIEVIVDKYNVVNSIVVRYLKKPSEFTILGDSITPCELPYTCFEDLVTGAVELYFNYKYKVSLAQQAAKARARAKAAKEDDDDDKTTEAAA